MSFDVLIENKRAVPVTVFNLDGSALCRIGAWQSFRCSTDDPSKPLARYDRIVFIEKGVDLSTRPGWQEPERRWPLTVEVGPDGPALEYRMFNGSPHCFMRGILYILDCPIQHEWALYEKITLNVGEQKRIPSKLHEGIYEFINILNDEPVLRSDAELERLEREVEALTVPVPTQVVMTPDELARAEHEADRRSLAAGD